MLYLIMINRTLSSDEHCARYSMRDPHVTHSIHWDKEAANKALQRLTKSMPLHIEMIGYSID